MIDSVRAGTQVFDLAVVDCISLCLKVVSAVVVIVVVDSNAVVSSRLLVGFTIIGSLVEVFLVPGSSVDVV